MSNVSSLNNRLNGYCNAFGNMKWNSERGELTKTPKAFFFLLWISLKLAMYECVKKWMRPTKVGAIKSVVALVVYDASRLLPSFFFRVDFGACEFINICFVSDKMILYAALFGVFFYLFVPLLFGILYLLISVSAHRCLRFAYRKCENHGHHCACWKPMKSLLSPW